ncbi:MAG TPA: ABC transporter permease [Candidatus Latescibacteria bacterium]|nr:ABC transporter permease [Candidatus Latescibacterota bacterium]
MRNNLEVIVAEVKKTAKIWLCYPVMLIFWGIFPLLWVLPFVFQGIALTGGLTSVPFKNLTGTENYIAFVLIGAMVSTYVFSGLWGVGNALREETYWGTLEFIIVSPTSPFTVLMGKTVAEFIYATLLVFMQALLSVFVFGIAITLGKLLPILFILVLLMIGFYGFAIAFAGLTLLIKEAHGLVHTMEWAFFLFSPIRYPVEINPITKVVSTVIPLTYALVAIRAILLLDKSFAQIWRVTLILGAMDVVFLGGGYLIFSWLERKTRRAGTIGMH